jgi:hypothetical protein
MRARQGVRSLQFSLDSARHGGWGGGNTGPPLGTWDGKCGLGLCVGFQSVVSLALPCCVPVKIRGQGTTVIVTVMLSHYRYSANM